METTVRVVFSCDSIKAINLLREECESSDFSYSEVGSRRDGEYTEKVVFEFTDNIYEIDRWLDDVEILNEGISVVNSTHKQ